MGIFLPFGFRDQVYPSTIHTIGNALKLGMRARRHFLAMGSILAISVQSTQAYAACVDNGVAAFAAAPQTVEICISEHCETAILSRLCGNIHYASADFETNVDQWLFRIRFHGDGVEDDEYSVFLNGARFPETAPHTATCRPKSSKDSCEFINRVLGNKLTE